MMMVAGERTENPIIKVMKVFLKKVHPLKPLGATFTRCRELLAIFIKENYLVKNDHNFEEKYYTAVGFPKVFYLKYHDAKYFPYRFI